MMIHVKYRNGNYGIVLAQQLEELITSRQISRFLRSSGWAVIGHDSLRSVNDPSYRGEERRSDG